MRKKKFGKYKWLLLILLGITVGYAIISTTLNMNGIVGVGRPSWNIHWENIANKSGVTPLEEPEIDEDENNRADALVSFSVQLNEFGDYYEFTIDAVNEGEMNAQVGSVNLYYNNQLVPSVIDEEHPSPLPEYVSYTIKNADGTDAVGTVINKRDTSTNPATPGRKTFKVRLEFSDENLSSSFTIDGEEVHNFGFKVNFDYTREEGGGSSSEPVQRLALGDYFTLVPDVSSYTVLATDTGWETDQTISPSELTLWRVVGRNNDGTYDAVSEYISSANINFDGKTGYINYVGVLQDVASKYAKSGYTVGTRAFGYDGQTLILDPDALDAFLAEDEFYWTPAVNTGTGVEYDNGVKGDTLYLKDTQMVSQFYRTYDDYGVGTYRVNDPEQSSCYLVASREVNMYDSDGLILNRVIFSTMTSSYIEKWFAPNSGSGHMKHSCGMRPIITIRSDLEIESGTGNKSDPYVFE